MADAPVLDPDVDPEYHEKYDTNNMTPEQYSALKVLPVRAPVTPHLNVPRLFDQLQGATDDEKEQHLRETLSGLDPVLVAALVHKWTFWARDNQLAPPGFWTFWLLLAGRGFGKTRTGAEWVNERVELGQAKRIALVAPTAADVRKVMVEGESGILAKAPPWNMPTFEPSKLQLTWPNGAIAQMFSAEEPERLRGPQCDTFWADEVCAWKKMQDTWDMLQFGFRLGKRPQGCVTTTPKPVPIIKELLAGEKLGTVVVTRGSTYENKANLAKPFFDTVVKKYEGTRLGRQELDAVILEDMPGALWARSKLDATRVPCNLPGWDCFVETDATTGLLRLKDGLTLDMLKRRAVATVKAIGEDLIRCAVAIDPNASNDEGSDEIGITVTGKGLSGRGYVLADGSMRGSPNEWASQAVLLHDLFDADRVIGEANNGGNMVQSTVESAAKFLKMSGLRKTDHIGVTLVHASRGKVTRAEPVSALYEQSRVSHVGTHPVLEDQMCLFTSDFDRKAMGYSPDRVDSLVWGLSHLFLEGEGMGMFEHAQRQAALAAIAKMKKVDGDAGRVRMRAPDGITSAYGMEGDHYPVENGLVMIKPGDVRGLRSAGFTEVTTELTDG